MWMPLSCEKASSPATGLFFGSAIPEYFSTLWESVGEVREIVTVDPSFHPSDDEHLLKRCIACPLADPIDRGMELEGTGLCSGDRVCHCTTHVVVAVGAERAVN